MPQISFILAATDDGPMILNRLDIHTNQHGHFGVGAELLGTGSHDRQDIDGLIGILMLCRKHHGEGVVAFDIGANIGTHTIAWGKLMRGWGRVGAIEAQERVFYALAGNVALNNLFNVTADQAVVGQAEGSVTIPVLDHERAASFGSLELRRCTEEDIGQIPGRTANVRMTTIDALAMGERVDLIKLDIEGMELDALVGAQATVDRCQPVIFAEWVKCGRAPLEQWLARRGYVTHILGMNLLAIHETDPVAQHVTPRAEQQKSPTPEGEA